MLFTPNDGLHLGQLQVCPAARPAWLGLRKPRAAQHCLRAAGPLATPWTAADDRGLISYLLIVNLMLV